MEEEAGIYREEVILMLEVLGDIRADTEESFGFWEARMSRKRKRTPEDRERTARAPDQIRRLRELAAKGRAELEARRRQRGSSG